MAEPNGRPMSLHELSLSNRVSRLEEERGQIAAEFSGLRTELRTSISFVRSALERIEDKLDERPSRTEMQALNPSRSPKVELVKDAAGYRVSLTRLPSVVLLAVIAAIVLATWLIRR